MANNFASLLPIPNDSERKKFNPEYAMHELIQVIDSKYSSHITGIIASTQIGAFADDPILEFTFYLVFSRRDNYSYPLFNAKCINNNGSYPLDISSHYGPPISHGVANDYSSFIQKMEEILAEEKTRNVILSMY